MAASGAVRFGVLGGRGAGSIQSVASRSRCAVLVGTRSPTVRQHVPQTTNGVLFGYKDFPDLVMSTCPRRPVVLSRITSLYAMSLLFSVLVMVPAFAVYASAAEVSAVGRVHGAVHPLAPLLPLATAVVLQRY